MRDVDYATYLNWNKDPFTIQYIKHLRELRDTYNDSLIHSGITDLSTMSRYIGKINVLDDILSLTYEDLTDKDS